MRFVLLQRPYHTPLLGQIVAHPSVWNKPLLQQAAVLRLRKIITTAIAPRGGSSVRHCLESAEQVGTLWPGGGGASWRHVQSVHLTIAFNIHDNLGEICTRHDGLFPCCLVREHHHRRCFLSARDRSTSVHLLPLTSGNNTDGRRSRPPPPTSRVNTLRPTEPSPIHIGILSSLRSYRLTLLTGTKRYARFTSGVTPERTTVLPHRPPSNEFWTQNFVPSPLFAACCLRPQSNPACGAVTRRC